MLTLNYTVEKEGIFITEDRLMLSERQINDFMDLLVDNGFSVESMSVADATL